LPENVVNQRLRLQLESIESPSELPGRRVQHKIDLTKINHAGPASGEMSLREKFRLQFDNFDCDSPVQLSSKPSRLLPATSPMTDLAINLCDTSLNSGLTPLPEIKKKLTMDYDSSPSPHSSLDRSSDSSTPLSSITNKLKRSRPIMRSFTAPFDLGESNKENIPVSRPSPSKSPLKLADSPITLKDRKSSTFQKIVQSPEFSTNKTTNIVRTGSMKRNMFALYEDEDSSRDSGYSSQPLMDVRARKKSRKEDDESMENILANCSPSKEDGLAPLSSSPNSKSTKSSSDGFDLETLPEMSDEEEEEESARNYSSLFSKKILMPRQESSLVKPFLSLSNSQNPLPLRRSMSCLNTDSPVSRESFKRPEPPSHASNCLGNKRKGGANSFMVERSISLQERGLAAGIRPSFHRSQSENDLNDQRKRACELKDDPNVLPDSSKKYCLPSTVNEKHPELRTINCHTLAEVLAGNHSSRIKSFRIIDVRYNFEYEGGHINGAENWQHGEDETFLKAFIPETALPAAPEYDPDNQEKRDILIFHCEFSSQRAPDFYKKLREKDRMVNMEVFPALYYPECYLLHLGYKEFFINYPDLCSGGYTEMIDDRYKTDLKRMRAKSKSWAGGTVSRISSLSRKFK